MSDPDLDAEFARIVAGWDAEAPDPLPRAAAADLVTDPDTAGSNGVDADGPADGPGSPDASHPDGATGQGGPATAAPTPSKPTNPPATTNAPKPGRPAGPPNPAGPSSPPSSSGLLELPIAPTTAHVWRGSTRPRDDAGERVDDDDHFVPPSDIDLPSAETDPMFWAIVGGLVGGPLLLLYVLFFDRDGSDWWVVTALTMVVVGFVLLVLRGGSQRDPFDDGTRL
ncbi:hypothetical protein [Terrabacter carboxydivorans]|uniref:hypothetical protein n=1 Tax=Terrabacter carboxydivorans TaxID=619730 RepID=UPI0031CE54BF